MAVLAEAISSECVNLIDDRNDGITDLLGLSLQFCPINLVDIAVFDDLIGSLLRNDAELALHFRERTLDVEVFRRAILVGPYCAHFRVTEYVTKNF